MQLALLQIKSEVGAIQYNLKKHKEWVTRACMQTTDLIIFPELSLTGYTTKQANNLALTRENPTWGVFSRLSNQHNTTIVVGCPLGTIKKPKIAAFITKPQQKTECYAKHLLHVDEQPFFDNGISFKVFYIAGKKIVFFICYESFTIGAHEFIIKEKPDLVLTSVAKTKNAMISSYDYLQQLAKNTVTPIGIVNCVGPCEGFIGGGLSAFWDANGKLIRALAEDEGILRISLKQNSPN